MSADGSAANYRIGIEGVTSTPPAVMDASNDAIYKAFAEQEATTTFRRHALEWKQATMDLSSLQQMISHPAYLHIIGMGMRAVPLLLTELEKSPDHWFVALNAITGEDPVREGDDFDGMVRAWLDWGRKNQYA
jgi:hypothetical protein